MGWWDQWASEGPAVFLESAGPLGDSSQWHVLAGYPESELLEKNRVPQFSGKDTAFPRGTSFWDFLDQISDGQEVGSTAPHFWAKAWFGILSYEFGKNHQLDRRPIALAESLDKNVPDYYFFKPRRVLAYNRQSKEYFLFGEKFQLEEACPREIAPFEAGPLRARMGWENYENIVKRALDYIARGDIYQANLAQSFEASWRGNAGSLYRVLREINPGPFMGIFRGPGFTVISSSPERLAAGRGSWLESRPIAGTKPRGIERLQDIQSESELKTSPKEQAEHLMLVDLARNDLGKVARYGTVEVPKYASVESYAKVHHLVSVVQALRREGLGTAEVFKSLFPGGTITGCPKIRCMEIIEELEGRPRGFYTGGMGYAAPGGCFDFNILIRSFTLWDDGKLDFYAGAGIVADSDPKREYRETLHKVEALAQALGTSLLETP